MIGYVTRIEQQEGDCFSVSVDVDVPEDETAPRSKAGTHLTVLQGMFKGGPAPSPAASQHVGLVLSR
jgi:hypothetical protein